jgi:hypothetical protein
MLLSLGGAVFAATASGDIVGLADVYTLGAIRPNTNTADLNGAGDYFEWLITRLIENASGTFDPIGFPTAADALAVTWSHNTPDMNNGAIDDATATAVPAPASIGGYYLSIYATNWAVDLGPDSWRATDGAGNTGDFSFVATDYLAQDSGEVNNIQIEFYDANPQTSTAFAAGAFDVVSGGDDRDSVDYGRSYPTPLDSVAHGTDTSPLVISTYHKILGKQDIQDIVDTSGNTHPDKPFEENEGWLYAVYYPDLEDPHTYNRDTISEVVGYDDYMLQRGALVIFAIGNIYDWKAYASYFPNTISR